MLSINNHKRSICAACKYPQSTCLCSWVNPVTSPINIIILQHPKEAKHAKNTVKLLTLGLKRVTVLLGEKPEDWTNLEKRVTEQPQNYSLLYPHEQSRPIESISSPEEKTQYFPANHNVLLIDASWRKALKMWHLNPWLHSLNSWHFSTPPNSQYRIRHSTQKNSLSTLEAIAYALQHTHNIDCSPLYQLFQKMQAKCFLKDKPNSAK